MEPSASPSGSTLPETGEPPLIVAKINDKGTNDRDDDKMAGGATFDIRVDDGDGKYEPGGDDGSPIVELDARARYSVYVPPAAQGDYWVKEKTPPKGLTTAPACWSRIRSASPENCIVLDGKKQCVADDDNTVASRWR